MTCNCCHGATCPEHDAPTLKVHLNVFDLTEKKVKVLALPKEAYDEIMKSLRRPKWWTNGPIRKWIYCIFMRAVWHIGDKLYNWAEDRRPGGGFYPENL